MRKVVLLAIILGGMVLVGCGGGNVLPSPLTPESTPGVSEGQRRDYLQLAAHYEEEAANAQATADACWEKQSQMSTSPIHGESYEEYYEAYREEIGELCKRYEELVTKYRRVALGYRELAGC